MITPHQLDLWSSNFCYLYNALEGEIIRQIIKRLDNGKTDMLDWQVDALKDLHLFNKDVAEMLAKTTGVAESEITKMFETAGNEIIKDVDKTMPYEVKPYPSNIDNILQSYVNQSWSEIDNLVNQTLVTTNYGQGNAMRAYMDVLNRTIMLFNAGMLTIEQALEKAIQELAHKGIRSGFIDRGGNSWSLERYVRTVLKSTLNNTYNELKTSRMAEYGVHTVVVTSHMGARHACGKIQGQVIDLRPMNELPEDYEYKSIYDPYWKARYGEAGGHRGVNCAHQHIPFIPGVNTNNQPQFDEKENAIVAQKREAQRYYERRLVRLKKNRMISEAMSNKEGIEVWQKDIRLVQQKIRELVDSSEYLSRDYKREKVYTPLDTLLKDFHFND